MQPSKSGGGSVLVQVQFYSEVSATEVRVGGRKQIGYNGLRKSKQGNIVVTINSACKCSLIRFVSFDRSCVYASEMQCCVADAYTQSFNQKTQTDQGKSSVISAATLRPSIDLYLL